MLNRVRLASMIALLCSSLLFCAHASLASGKDDPEPNDTLSDSFKKGGISYDAKNESFNQAMEKYRQGDYAVAAGLFEKLTQMPDCSEKSRFFMAKCYEQKGQSKAAREQYLFLYSKGKDKSIRYNAWLALKAAGGISDSGTKRANAPGASSRIDQSKVGKAPGADAWVTPKEGYGKSGPPATSTLEVEIIPTSCSRRHR